MKTNSIKLFVFSKQKKTKDGKRFTSYSTKYNTRIDGGERKSIYYDVKFVEDAFTKESGLTIKDIKRGYLIVNTSAIGCPDAVVTRTNENGKNYFVVVGEDGKDERPTCWLRKDAVIGYEEVLKEHEFHFDANEESTDEVDVEETENQ